MMPSPISLLTTPRRFWVALLASLLVFVSFGAYGPVSSAAQVRSVNGVKMGGTVTIDNVSGSLWTCGFNPYSTAVGFLSDGIIYEPLIYINQLNAKETPWLATGYKWSNGDKTLAFTMRPNVKWSDGKPLTAADVVFTFQLLKKFSALDLNAVWTVLSSVRQQGNQVIFQFKHPAVPYLYFIAGQDYILPQHIWSKIKNPVTYADKSPVGSGPFVMSKCSPQNITYLRNAHYWQPGKPYISRVEYPAFMDNQPGNLYLAQGKANWGGQYVPNIKTYYIARDPAHRHYWFPPSGSNVGLYPNLTVYPLNILAVRKAISYGLDRAKISRLGVYGYLPPANQTGIILPTWQKWYAQNLARQHNYSYNPSKAIALLKQAGFKRGANGMFQTKAGKPLSLSVINVGGYTDWVAEVKIIADSLRAIGINLTPENLSQSDYVAREQSGRFQLAYGDPPGGPTPYYQYSQLLYSANTAPIGKQASSNYERFRSKYVDLLLKNYARIANPARQREVIKKIQQVMLTQVPIIPVLEGVQWFQYDTSQIVGWPTAANPYASPAPYNSPDWEVVLTRVHLK